MFYVKFEIKKHSIAINTINKHLDSYDKQNCCLTFITDNEK